MVGAIVSESLRPGSHVDAIDLHLRKMARYFVPGHAPAQPGEWTLIEFTGPASVANQLAEQLSAAILVEGGWYANFSTSDEVFVVYGGHIFRYPRGDAAGRAQAQHYGRSHGVPETQLDWGE